MKEEDDIHLTTMKSTPVVISFHLFLFPKANNAFSCVAYFESKLHILLQE